MLDQGRRDLIVLLGSAAASAASWPLAARAQSPRKLPTIGLLGSGTAAAQSQWTAAFVHALDISQAQDAARTLGVDIESFEIRRGEDIAPAFQALQRRAEALYVPAVPLMFANRVRINTFALTARLPTMYYVREYVEVGGLISYGPNWPEMWRRAADFVDKILRGSKPADLPVEQPTKFDLIVNLTTAKALRLEVPTSLLVRADEVIE